MVIISAAFIIRCIYYKQFKINIHYILFKVRYLLGLFYDKKHKNYMNFWFDFLFSTSKHEE